MAKIWTGPTGKLLRGPGGKLFWSQDCCCVGGLPCGCDCSPGLRSAYTITVPSLSGTFESWDCVAPEPCGTYSGQQITLTYRGDSHTALSAYIDSVFAPAASYCGGQRTALKNFTTPANEPTCVWAYGDCLCGVYSPPFTNQAFIFFAYMYISNPGCNLHCVMIIGDLNASQVCALQWIGTGGAGSTPMTDACAGDAFTIPFDSRTANASLCVWSSSQSGLLVTPA